MIDRDAMMGELIGLVDVDLESGRIDWKRRPEGMFKDRRSCSTWNSRYAGKRAFNCKSGHGPLVGRFRKINIAAHQVIWYAASGSLPTTPIYHSDLDVENNSIHNLTTKMPIDYNPPSRSGAVIRSAAPESLSASDVSSLLSYDPKSGRLRYKTCGDEGVFKKVYGSNLWVMGAWNKRNHGNLADKKIRADGYRSVGLLGNLYLAHRLALAIINGEWPNEVDHENGLRHDNRLENLRDVSRQQNAMNRRIQSNNTSGATGVKERRGKFSAFIKVNGKTSALGTFSTFDMASKVRRNAEREMGFHSNHADRMSEY